MDKTRELTKAELQIMQVLWKKERAFVNEIREEMSDPRPAYNTISTVLRVLVEKEFVSYQSYGKTYQYFPLVNREDYMERYMSGVVNNFFSGSVKAVVSFFARKEKLSSDEIDEIIDILNENKK
ncbi:MAG: BlaI/MecI/CopY family transcriptional regulator [Odoribacter splanchnicus]|nr:BlaI/MecI/CopY family transcriptional regulator [Odoribacter splanchnicus]